MSRLETVAHLFEHNDRIGQASPPHHVILRAAISVGYENHLESLRMENNVPLRQAVTE